MSLPLTLLSTQNSGLCGPTLGPSPQALRMSFLDSRGQWVKSTSACRSRDRRKLPLCTRTHAPLKTQRKPVRGYSRLVPCALYVPLWGVKSVFYICHLLKPIWYCSVILLHVNKPRLRRRLRPKDRKEMRWGFEFSGLLTLQPRLWRSILRKPVEAGVTGGGRERRVFSSAAP